MTPTAVRSARPWPAILVLTTAIAFPLACAAPTAREQHLEAHDSDLEHDAELVRVFQAAPFEPPVVRLQPRPEDMGLTPDQIPTAGTRLFHTDPTAGWFPAAMAVAQIDVQRGETADQRLVRVKMPATHDAVWWNELLDDVPEIREIVISDEYAQNPDRINIDSVLHVARRLNCTFCVTFTRWGEPIYREHVIAALWHCDSGALLATFRSDIEIDPLMYGFGVERDGADARDFRAGELAARALLRNVRSAVTEFVARDVPATQIEPSPWINDRPLIPRDGRPIHTITPVR
jgi:hypothetical protein